MTLEPWKSSENTLLLRLEHILEKDEDPILSKPVTVNLDVSKLFGLKCNLFQMERFQGLFTYFDVDGIQEMTLAANQAVDSNEKLEWIIGDNLSNLGSNGPDRKFKYEKPSLVKDSNIVLHPMEIRTFLISVTYNSVEHM